MMETADPVSDGGVASEPATSAAEAPAQLPVAPKGFECDSEMALESLVLFDTVRSPRDKFANQVDAVPPFRIDVDSPVASVRSRPVFCEVSRAKALGLIGY